MLQSLKFGCFSNSGLTEIIVPMDITCLEDSVFSGCDKLRKVSFQDGSKLEKIGKMCFSCSGITGFRAPPGLREIGPDAFANCKYLRRVELNEGLEELVVQKGKQYNKNRGQVSYDGIFYGSGLEELILPSTLRKINSNALDGCDNLKRIFVKDDCAISTKNYT